MEDEKKVDRLPIMKRELADLIIRIIKKENHSEAELQFLPEVVVAFCHLVYGC